MTRQVVHLGEVVVGVIESRSDRVGPTWIGELRTYDDQPVLHRPGPHKPRSWPVAFTFQPGDPGRDIILDQLRVRAERVIITPEGPVTT